MNILFFTLLETTTIIMKMKHKFVEFVPEKLDEGILYISIKYRTVNHNCACGCGLEVVTPISPPDWQLTYNGETISLHPSIGNWDYPCESHYWIKKNKVVWARKWSSREIENGRLNDKYLSESYSNSNKMLATKKSVEKHNIEQKLIKKRSWFQRILFRIKE